MALFDIKSFVENLGQKMPAETEVLSQEGGPFTLYLRFLKVLIMTAFMNIISAFGGKIKEEAKNIGSKVVNKVNQIVQKIKKIIKIVKKIIEIAKKIIDAAIKIVKVIAQLYFTFPSPSCWVAWGITIVVAILIFFAVLFGRYGSFQGEFMIDFDKMKEMKNRKRKIL